jgi:hypothetical protein
MNKCDEKNFSKLCPHCGYAISISRRSGLIWHSTDTCPKCNGKYQIQRRAMTINAIAFGFVFGIVWKAFFNLSVLEIALWAAAFTLIFQRFLDYVFEPLEVSDDK